MKHSQSLQNKLEQILSPQLLELLKILQMPRLELQQLIRHEIEQNPFLEEEMSEDDDESETTIKEKEESKSDKKDEIDFEYFYHDDWKKPGIDFSKKKKEHENFNPVDIYSEPISFKQHLLTQVHIKFGNHLEMEVAEFIVTSLSDDGFLKVDHENEEENIENVIIKTFNITHKNFENILDRIRLLDPIGVGSRNVRECFLTQLKYKKMTDTFAFTIINDFYDDFLKNKMYRISNKIDISNDEFKIAIEDIKKLNPKPANGEWGKSSNYIVPDILVRKQGDEFIPEINSNYFPEVHLNKRYLDILQGKNKLTKKEEKFLKKRLNSAIFLVSGINKRNKTLLNISERIIMLQKEFFHFGISALKPMVLQDISNYLGIHESTVSRATYRKYIDTAKGIFPFKFFFSRSILTEEGNTSSTNVKDIIKKVIEKENQRTPLTDQRIVDILKDQYKIMIARRTVAKYREIMDILPASKRKKYFKEVE